MSHDPMAPEALALGALPEAAREVVLARLERFGHSRTGEVAQALGLTIPPQPEPKRRTPAATHPARLASPNVQRLLTAGACRRGHAIAGEADLYFRRRAASSPVIDGGCKACRQVTEDRRSHHGRPREAKGQDK